MIETIQNFFQQPVSLPEFYVMTAIVAGFVALVAQRMLKGL